MRAVPLSCRNGNTMEDLADVWRAGALIFSARTDSGDEVVFWLIPGPPTLVSLPSSPRVVYATSRLTSPPEDHAHLFDEPLVPQWWLFDRHCSARLCTCGPRSLQEVVALLPTRAAHAAVCAHHDLLDALRACPRTHLPSDLHDRLTTAATYLEFDAAC